MNNVNKTKKQSFLFRMITMMMAALTLAITMALPVSVSASAAEAPIQAAVGFESQIMPLADDPPAGGGATLDSQTDGDDQFESVLKFFVKWIKRVGLLVAFVGGVMFALAIKGRL